MIFTRVEPLTCSYTGGAAGNRIMQLSALFTGVYAGQMGCGLGSQFVCCTQDNMKQHFNHLGKRGRRWQCQQPRQLWRLRGPPGLPGDLAIR